MNVLQVPTRGKGFQGQWKSVRWSGAQQTHAWQWILVCTLGSAAEATCYLRKKPGLFQWTTTNLPLIAKLKSLYIGHIWGGEYYGLVHTC